MEEAAKLLHFSLAYAYRIRKESIQNGTWLTHEELKELEKKKKQKLERAKKEEQARLDAERREAEKAIKEAEALAKASNEERKRKIKKYEDLYREYRKQAKKEDNLELAGQENVSIEGRRKFIEVLIELNALEADIPDKDITIVFNAFDMHPEIADTNSIKLLISDAYKKCGAKSMETMIIELTKTLNHTKYYEPLVQYRQWLRKLSLRPKIQDMKKRNMSNTEIGSKLGISSLEVGMILRTDKKPDFSDFGNR